MWPILPADQGYSDPDILHSSISKKETRIVVSFHSVKQVLFVGCLFFKRYEARTTDLDEDKRQYRVERINSDLLKKLMELDTDLYFSDGIFLMVLWLTIVELV